MSWVQNERPQRQPPNSSCSGRPIGAGAPQVRHLILHMRRWLTLRLRRTKSTDKSSHRGTFYFSKNGMFALATCGPPAVGHLDKMEVVPAPGSSPMPLRITTSACLMGLLVTGLGVSQPEAPPLELRAVELTALTNAERDRFLAAHNAARKTVGVDPLAWSDELAQVAHDWLAEQKDKLIEEVKEGWEERRIVLPDHRMDDKYGENIAGWAGTKVAGAERAVAGWLAEKAAFDKLNADGSYQFGDEKGKTETDVQGKEKPVIVGHYTQIVWKGTTHVGAAKLTFQLADDRGHERTYVAIVCNYDPAGNIRGEKPF